MNGNDPSPSAGRGQPLLLPEDAFNRELVEAVHPRAWRNPEPAGRYNLVVLGGGTAGLVSAAGAAGLGARVALVERHLLGGDCLNYGCVPSKGVLRAARAFHDVRMAGAFGVNLAGAAPGGDFGAAMERMRRLRAGIAHHDSARRFTSLGVDVFLGEGRFTGPDRLEVEGTRLRFQRAVIATGARAAALPVPGLAEAGFLTNETVFSLTTLPRRLAVIGAGPIGCELAQAFRRFGSQVAVIALDPQLLPREDADAAGLLARQFEREGMLLHLGAKLSRVERRPEGKAVWFDRGRGSEQFLADEMLLAVGRTPNVEGLGLEAAGVAFGRSGVAVDDRLRTSNPRIYAAGDVCSAYQFTHAADAMARVVLQNAFFFGRKRVRDLVIPWVTYTDPEIAHVGLTEREAAARRIPVQTFTVPFAEIDRAVLDGEEEGLARLHVGPDSRILGATAVARHAGEMIGELVLAMSRRLKAGALSGAIHPYPTQAEAWRRLGDAYLRTRLTPGVRRWLGRYFAWRR
ncbi:MAG: mercuric reductase [Candidatus Lambdaproteobacteria bacterium]|nr:mercuric reductase [Candidatus Lambdaproteobacteria bacterium]